MYANGLLACMYHVYAWYLEMSNTSNTRLKEKGRSQICFATPWRKGRNTDRTINHKILITAPAAT